MRMTPAVLAAMVLFLGANLALAAGPSALGPDGKLPHGGRPEQRVAFPPIADWRSLRITLDRTGCFGSCPAYSVEIDGDGRVRYTGTRDVAVAGRRTARIAKSEVQALYAAFRKADFFWLLDSYRAPITDLPEYTVTFAYDGRSKSVIDYAGGMIGMPRDVVDLETLIDKTARSRRWIVKPGAR